MIGTMTFHWATNYGAVLQAYALQKYLLDNGYQTRIINYKPIHVFARQIIRACLHRDRVFFHKEKNIDRFRKEYLLLTNEIYYTHRSLKRCADTFKTIIVGSDQIWNESFTLRAEGKPTLSYFADFSGSRTKRIGYAVSFGFHDPSDTYIGVTKNAIARFDAISVREDDGCDILAKYNIKSTVVCDPTMLLDKTAYLQILSTKENNNKKDVFAYIINERNAEAWKTANYLGRIYNCPIDEEGFCGSMEEWLGGINDSRIVITNSFHVVVLSLLLNKPFIAFLITGSGMNSRITSLLEKMELTNRILEEFDEELVCSIINDNIDWNEVNRKIDSIRKTGIEYLQRVLSD